jgi:Zn-dependent protease
MLHRVLDDDRSGLRIFGFPLEIRPFYFLIVVMLGLRGRVPSDAQAVGELALWVVVATISILWHELGHAFVMRRYGYSPSIVLHGMGGATHWNDGPTPTPMQRVWVSLAGPFAGFILGGLVWAVALLVPPQSHPAVVRAIDMLLWVNIGWGLINLIPMVPWDGGHAVHGLLDRITNGRGARPTAILTFVVGALALAYTALVVHSLWLSFLVMVSLAAAYQLWKAAEHERPLPRRAPAPPPDPVEPVRDALERIDPEVLVSAILRKRPGTDWRPAASSLGKHLDATRSRDPQVIELAAWASLMAGDVDAAEARVASMAPTYSPSAALAALLAARRGRWAAALETARELEGEDELPVRHRIEAQALIALRRAPEAIALAERSDRATAAFIGEALFHAGHYDDAARLAEASFARHRQADDAYNAACSHARAGRPAEALRWLESAVEAGYRDLAHLEADEDLAPVRKLEGYAALRTRLRG